MSYIEAFQVAFARRRRKPERATTIEVHDGLTKAGYRIVKTVEMGQVNYCIPDKVAEFQARLDEQGGVIGPWTMFFGPNSLWRYSLYVRDDVDEVALKLLFSED